MSTLNDVCDALRIYASEHNIWMRPSGVYDLFPSDPQALQSSIAYRFPNAWPNGKDHGVYLFFSADAEPRFLYVGKSSGKTSCIKMRLNGYIDLDARRSRGECILRVEWNGRRCPWGTSPRYLVTVALRTDNNGECPQAIMLEDWLKKNLAPSENVLI
jgi:hypothetical protein